jgi:hypothetical protein
MAAHNNVNAKRYQKPCYIDGQYFRTIAEAWIYLQGISGRVYLDRLERHIRQGRRFMEGHAIGRAREGGGIDSLPVHRGRRIL